MEKSIDDRFKTGGALAALSAESPVLENKLQGKVLSGYLVGDVLGAGGMGYVVHGQRVEGDFEREVAIKIVETTHQTSEFAQRFRREVQILAQLNHPHIAQLFDAGESEAGWPYLVMEYVNGQPIDSYCHTQELPLNDRIQLLLQIAQALQFAHAQLIVHRDLKPSNVLVDHTGAAKLLDFGIAMLVDEKNGSLTEVGAMTPQFASPEQLLGEPISIATDIYQFGLLMTKVLCGSLPTQDEQLSDAIARAANRRPVTLSTEQRAQLPTELVLIIEHCLRTEATERYQDARSLSQDLSAFLTGHPVSAVGQNKRYLFKKFVARNKAAVSAALLAVLALITATFVTSWQMIEAQNQRDIAVYQQQRVQASSEFYSLLFEEMGDGAFTSINLLDRGRSLLEDQFGTGQPFMGSVLLDVSRRYASLGELNEENELLNEASRIAREHQDDNLLAAILCQMARSNQVRDRELATAQRLEGLALYQSLASPSIDTSLSCARAHADYLIKAGNYSGALEVLIDAKHMADRSPAVGVAPLALLLNDIGSVYYYSRQTDKAIPYLDEVLELLDSNGRGATLRYQRIAANRAVTLQTSGRTKPALIAFDELMHRMQTSGFAGRGTAILHTQYGDLLIRVGRTDDAEAAYAQGLARALANGNGRIASASHIGLVKVHVTNGDLAAAREQLEGARQYVNAGEPRPLAISVEHFSATLDRLEGNLPAAQARIDRLLDELGYPTTQHGPGLFSTLTEGAITHSAAGNHARAAELAAALVERVELETTNREGNIDLGLALLTQAQVLQSAQQYDAAEKALDLALPQLSKVLHAEHPKLIEAHDLRKTIVASMSASALRQ